MRLSILIPTYNTKCLSLVEELQRQLPDDCEIILADDGSTDTAAKAKNREMAGWKGVTYKEGEKNLGRAWIRNWLTQQAQGDYVLFIDSDAVVENPHFLTNYLRCLPTEAVVCGGILHPATLPSPAQSLRWAYEKHCEPKFTADKRICHPYHCLRTFNFMMPRQIALAHPFDEEITRYGYEDTLLGRQLEEDDIEVWHIENPLTNGDIETNQVFLQKTEEAMKTLHDIRHKIGRYSRLLVVYRRLQRFHLTGILRFTYKLIRPLLRRNLLGVHPSVRLFNFYKLGYYACLPN